MQKRLIAHVDMDCFFAACEMKKDPTLRGKPLIIGASPNSPRGVVCTASYEARKFGVHSALPISQAVKLCPQGIYKTPDFSYYCEQSRLIMQTLAAQTQIHSVQNHSTQVHTTQYTITQINSTQINATQSQTNEQISPTPVSSIQIAQIPNTHDYTTQLQTLQFQTSQFLPSQFQNAQNHTVHIPSQNTQESLFEQISIDEANLDVTNLATKFKSLLELGKYLRALVYKQTGFSCSVGIAPSRRVAKIAAGYKKPHGVTVVYDMRDFLAPMPIGTIPGIGKKSVPLFESLGIKTIGDLAKKDRFFVLEKLGRYGLEHWILASGQDFSIILPHGQDQSYSREETYMHDLRDAKLIQENLATLCKEVFGDLGHSTYKTVSIKVRYDDFTTITRSKSFSFASSALQHLTDAVDELARTQIDYRRPIRLLGVKLSNLTHSSARQLSLFDFSSCDSFVTNLYDSLTSSSTSQTSSYSQIISAHDTKIQRPNISSEVSLVDFRDKLFIAPNSLLHSPANSSVCPFANSSESDKISCELKESLQLQNPLAPKMI